MTVGVVGRAAPIHAAGVSGENDGAPEGGRSKDSCRARRGDFFGAPFFVVGSKSKGVLRRHAFRDGGNTGWLCGPRFFAVYIGFGGRLFFPRNEGRCVHGSEDKNAPP